MKRLIILTCLTITTVSCTFTRRGESKVEVSKAGEGFCLVVDGTHFFCEELIHGGSLPSLRKCRSNREEKDDLYFINPTNFYKCSSGWVEIK